MNKIADCFIECLLSGILSILLLCVKKKQLFIVRTILAEGKKKIFCNYQLVNFAG